MLIPILSIIVMCAAIFLQSKLAKEDNGRYSLMLPLLFFISAIIVTLFMIFITFGGPIEVMLTFAFSAFFMANIPTLIMLLTRLIVRKHYKL